jgi:hypothetical protein
MYPVPIAYSSLFSLLPVQSRLLPVSLVQSLRAKWLLEHILLDRVDPQGKIWLSESSISLQTPQELANFMRHTLESYLRDIVILGVICCVKDRAFSMA